MQWTVAFLSYRRREFVPCRICAGSAHPQPFGVKKFSHCSAFSVFPATVLLNIVLRRFFKSVTFATICSLPPLIIAVAWLHFETATAQFSSG